MQELAQDFDEGAAAASRDGSSGSQQEETPGTAVPAMPLPRLASRRDSLTLSTMLKQQKASCLAPTTVQGSCYPDNRTL